MRLVPVILLAALLAFAGCFGKSNTTPSDTTGTTPVSSTPAASSTPVSSTPTPGAGSNATAPPMLAPKVILSKTHDFANDATSSLPSPAGSAVTPDKVTIDPGYTTLSLYVNWTIDNGAPAAPNPSSPTVTLGSLSCVLSDEPVQTPAPCAKSGSASAGPAQVTYAGAGPFTATIKVVES
jgi:hypothetical protein